MTIEKSAVLYADNPDIGFVYPEQNSAVPDGVALIKDCPNEENAKLFIDFVTSAECQTAQNADWARRPVRSDITPKGSVLSGRLPRGQLRLQLRCFPQR